MLIAECPFLPDPELPRQATWVEPVLVAVVEFKEWTKGPRLRAPSFKGFGDVPAAAVTWEAEGPDH
jgi:ATP-dependent DNA ligase